MTAPTAVSLPADPFETLAKGWGLLDLDIYEERWKVEDPKALAFLRRSLAPGKGIAERHWQTNTDGMLHFQVLFIPCCLTESIIDQYDCFLQHRALSPILSAQAVRDTPRPGNYAAYLPQRCSSLLQDCSIECVESSLPVEVPINVDDVLYVNPLREPCGYDVETDRTSRANKLVIDPGMHVSVLALIHKVPTMAGRATDAPSPLPIDDFLRAESPPIDFPVPELLPLFPRDQRPGRHVEQSAGTDTPFATSLDAFTHPRRSWLFPVSVKEEDEDDIANENLVLVDGWRECKDFKGDTLSNGETQMHSKLPHLLSLRARLPSWMLLAILTNCFFPRHLAHIQASNSCL